MFLSLNCVLTPTMFWNALTCSLPWVWNSHSSRHSLYIVLPSPLSPSWLCVMMMDHFPDKNDWLTELKETSNILIGWDSHKYTPSKSHSRNDIYLKWSWWWYTPRILRLSVWAWLLRFNVHFCPSFCCEAPGPPHCGKGLSLMAWV